MLMKLYAVIAMCVVWAVTWQMIDVGTINARTELSVQDQFNGTGAINQATQTAAMGVYQIGWGVIAVVAWFLFVPSLIKAASMREKPNTSMPLILGLILLGNVGCWRPFEPVELETIKHNEEGFLIPYKGDIASQASTNSLNLLEKSLVQAKQIQIPQQWVPKGYEYRGANGTWKPAAILIKVDRSPVTCMWTADPNSGTGKSNEAIWVMTSDQVEFSTGWTCTARVDTREDCVKFLYNYPNGSIKYVLDTEVRAYVQTSFGLEVTDQPMSKLRSDATPHILAVVTKVREFFKVRGLTITNLGISGGFIYTDTKIRDRITELFNAEQGEALATSKANALHKEAEGLASAAKTKAEGEATAIKTIADAKAYEIDKAKEDLVSYLELKRLELKRHEIERWDGKFPSYWMNSGTPSQMLLQSPSPTK